jgi:FMN phosphatase YigB (HAD superfamily)
MLIIFDLDDTLYDCTGQVIRNPDGTYVHDFITLFPGVKAFLSQDNFKKVLVTKGSTELQNRKLNILNINLLFDEIMICDTDSGKESCFQKVLEENSEEKQVIVLGDRIDSEIRYGNKLGLKTVLLKQGKYKNLKANDHLEVPDHTFESFESFVANFEGLFSCKQ